MEKIYDKLKEILQTKMEIAGPTALEHLINTFDNIPPETLKQSMMDAAKKLKEENLLKSDNERKVWVWTGPKLTKEQLNSTKEQLYIDNMPCFGHMQVKNLICQRCVLESPCIRATDALFHKLAYSLNANKEKEPLKVKKFTVQDKKKTCALCFEFLWEGEEAYKSEKAPNKPSIIGHTKCFQGRYQLIVS